MMISRAGYNTVNEILLTGAKAVLIPECHGGGEQEQRAMSIQNVNILVAGEEDILNGSSGSKILDFMHTKMRRLLTRLTSMPRERPLLTIWRDGEPRRRGEEKNASTSDIRLANPSNTARCPVNRSCDFIGTDRRCFLVTASTSRLKGKFLVSLPLRKCA